MSEELVDVVNEKDEVVGVATREEAHIKSLLHRIVEVWFYDSHKRVLLQKRSLKKKNLPGLLDFTVGGHVSSGETYEEALLKETREETGVVANVEDFTFVNVFIPQVHGSINDLRLHIRKTYLYPFKGTIQDLSFDAEEVGGFAWWEIDDLIAEIKAKPDRFVPFAKHQTTFDILEMIKTKTHS